MAGPSRIDELRKKFDENPRRYFAPLANEYRKLGDFEQAIFICQEFLPQQPGHMSGHIVYGQALFEAARHDEARTVFETALSLDPENLIALRHLGDIARAHGDTETARAWYRRVLDSDPRNEEIAAILQALDSDPTGGALATASSGGATAPADSTSAGGGVPSSARASSDVGEPAGQPPLVAPELSAPFRDSAPASEGSDRGEAPAETAFSPLAGFGSARGEGGSDLPSFEQEADLDALFPTSASGAGGNMYQDAPPLEAPAHTLPPDDALSLTASPPNAAFVTETMAELYLQQGHKDEAIGVFRQLVALHPEDAALRERLRQLEVPAPVASAPQVADAAEDAGPTIRDFLASLASWRPRTADARRVHAEAPPSHAAGRVEPERVPADMRSPSPSPGRATDTVGGSLDALFAGAESTSRETARSPLEAAFSTEPAPRADRQREDEGAPLRGRPATPAATELSLDHVFRHATPGAGGQAQGGFSFDQFFSQQAQNDAASAAQEPAREPEGSEGDDIQQFNAWLEGLKKS